jgi:DNA helicase IV
VLQTIDEPHFNTLRTVRSLYRSQIVVDEATDFSPLQLACMAQLADPAIESFVACGDFNQRVTVWGTRSENELRWVFPDFDIRSIVVTYRHSRQMNDFARALRSLSGAGGADAELPEHLSTDGYDPVVAKALEGGDRVTWLAARICEIEQTTGKLPSIAVFVPSEDEVQPIALALNNALSGQNIRCVACPSGQVRGQDNDVRVFDVQHIKGLEFEAVFFVDVDELARRYPDLFDKFLYVGATRAATYLGLTSRADLPTKLAQLTSEFGVSWR